MKPQSRFGHRIALFVLAAVVVARHDPLRADVGATGSGGDAPSSPHDAAADKTGTNPLNFQRTLQLSNEYDHITDDAEINYLRVRYTEPLSSTLSLRLEVPLVYAHAAIAGNSATGAGDGGSPAPPDPGGETDVTDTGLGDVVLKASYVPYVTRRNGLLVAGELAAPTASDDVLGTGKWVLSPTATYAWFFPNGLLFAPAYKHSFSFAGDDDRADIHKGSLDFYLVYKFDRMRQWVVLDPTYFLDYEQDRYSGGTFRATYGRLLGKAGDAVVSAYVRPGVGVGADRPYDWSLEVAVTLIGF